MTLPASPIYLSYQHALKFIQDFNPHTADPEDIEELIYCFNIIKGAAGFDSLGVYEGTHGGIVMDKNRETIAFTPKHEIAHVLVNSPNLVNKLLEYIYNRIKPKAVIDRDMELAQARADTIFSKHAKKLHVKLPLDYPAVIEIESGTIPESSKEATEEIEIKNADWWFEKSNETKKES